jgi:activating signal cointegrator complex subunit 3
VSACLCGPCITFISLFQGTEVYDREHGCFEDIDVLDVQQIFGRAGRPQFGSSGESLCLGEAVNALEPFARSLGNGILIGTSWKVQRYVEHLTSRTPIESRLPSRLNDLLCAEVLRGEQSRPDVCDGGDCGELSNPLSALQGR